MLDKFYIHRTEDAKDLPLPTFMTEGSAGMDIFANVEKTEIIKPSEIKLIKSGLKTSIPKGYEIQIRPRSGIAYRNGVTMVNSPGTIDSDYRGEICLIMINHGKEDFIINRGDRIGQMVISKVYNPEFIEIESLDETARGQGGFGHTGIN